MMRWIEFGPAARRSAAPSFELALPDGTPVTRSQYRSKAQLVLVFAEDHAQPDVDRLLQSLAARHDEFTEVPAPVYAVSPDAPPGATAIPVLVDRQGQVGDAYRDLFPPGDSPADGEPFVFVLDRYGTPGFAGYGLSAPDEDAEAILTRVWGLAYECPE